MKNTTIEGLGVRRVGGQCKTPRISALEGDRTQRAGRLGLYMRAGARMYIAFVWEEEPAIGISDCVQPL